MVNPLGNVAIGAKVYATGYSQFGQLRGVVEGYTKSGMYRVRVDSDQHAKAGEIVRTSWVSAR